MSEKYAFWVTLRPQLDRYRQGEAEAHILDFKQGEILRALLWQSDFTFLIRNTTLIF